MPTEAVPNLSPALDPLAWIDLLTVHALKRDIFSSKTLVVIIDGLEQLATVRATPGSPVTITRYHVTIFDRLRQSFNNPTLLKEIGIFYLGEFGMPGIALKHFELAHQFAPKDRDIEELQTAATMALARVVTNQPNHSAIDEAQHPKPELSQLIRRTARIDVVEARRHLDETAGELERKKQAWRKTGTFKPKSQPLPDFRPAFEMAGKHIAQADFAAATAILEEAKQAGAPKEELQAYYAQLGLAAFDYGRMEEALEAFSQTRDLGPESIEGWFNCGLVYQKMGWLDDALDSYQNAVRLAPDNSKVWCNLSSVWFERGDYAESEKSARKALELRPDYARAWDNLAATLGIMNRLPEAAEACRQAIHIQPSLHSAWFKLGVINFQQDNFSVAMEAFNLTGDNPAFFPHVLYYLSMIEARRGELNQALQKLAQARSADPANDLEFSALKEIGAACTKLGRHATAADFYSQILTKRPDDFSACLALGTAYHRAEQLDRARVAYRRAIELQPDNPLPWHNLGLVASDQGNHQESRDCFQREVELCPDDAKAWYDLAVSFQALGQEAEGQAAYEHAEGLVKSNSRRSSDLSAALSIVRRLNLGDRVLKTE